MKILNYPKEKIKSTTEYTHTQSHTCSHKLTRDGVAFCFTKVEVLDDHLEACHCGHNLNIFNTVVM